MRGINNRPGPGVAGRLFQLHLQIYFAVVTFLGLFYAGTFSLVSWPLYAAILWAVLLFVQFLLVYGRHKNKKHR